MSPADVGDGITMVAASQPDMQQFWPNGIIRFQGFVFKRGNDVLGVSGLRRSNGLLVLFSEWKGTYPAKLLWRCAKMVMSRIKNLDESVYAVVDPENSAAQRWVKRLGFELKFSFESQEVYEWQKPQPQ